MTGGNISIIYDGKIYVGGLELFCFDLETTELLWRTPLPDNAGVGAFLVADDKLYARSSDYVYALNPSNAQVIWRRGAISNTSGDFAYHNGILYYPDGVIQRINGSTGELLGEMESPDYANDNGAFFAWGITIDPTTNRLYASNYKNALCYQLPE